MSLRLVWQRKTEKEGETEHEEGCNLRDIKKIFQDKETKT